MNKTAASDGQFAKCILLHASARTTVFCFTYKCILLHASDITDDELIIVRNV